MSQCNISLLAKQEWRIINNQDSLVTHAVKSILEKGTCWRVGTGTNISINDDAWIPNAVNFRLSLVVNTIQDSKVNELIDSNERIWKRELINNTFSKEDAGKILQIPLVRTPHDDLLIWGGEFLGEFSVCSAYKLLQTFDDIPRAYALQIAYRNFYKTLWLLNLPTEIKGERNTRMHEKKKSIGLEIANFINNYIAELNGLERKNSAKGKEIRRWSHPSREFVKIKFDEIHQGVTSAFAAKAIACRKAVQVGFEKEWLKIIVKGDSLTIIKKYLSKSQDRSHTGAYIYDIQQKTNRSRRFKFKHTPRPTNALAHILAIETLKKKGNLNLEMSVPGYTEKSMKD
ncbi:hypothetical protein CXB51_029529 [Gossypium anomalum]|uniref:RNase H type-1 domain-containing protein n=1 Tax=Gossypium anomalum TaxID=47600 RepID=A0A8J5Y8X5_9ROSI|nr:hypothetical protein CXB51_029529 [Gossypium anomalum]